MTSDAALVGQISWRDLTVADAERVKQFYSQVVGWRAEEVDMGGYHDYAMTPSSGGPPVAGICHARGPNQDLPPAWLVYITVADLDRSLQTCLDLGGRVVTQPRPQGQARFCVIEDPAGAVVALYCPQP